MGPFINDCTQIKTQLIGAVRPIRLGSRSR